jgi:YggT family protein
MGQLIFDFYWMIIRPLITLYTFVIFANVILSWLVSFNVVNPRNQFVAAVYRITVQLTEPALRPIRNILPPMAGLDFSPVILLLILWYLNGSVLPWLFLSLARAIG